MPKVLLCCRFLPRHDFLFCKTASSLLKLPTQRNTAASTALPPAPPNVQHLVPFLCLPPLPTLLRARPRGLTTTRTDEGVQLLRGCEVTAPLPYGRRCGGGAAAAVVSTLGVKAADDGDGGGEHRLEGRGDKVTPLVEPFGEGAGEGDGLRLAGFGSEGYVEVVDGGILLGGGCDFDLEEGGPLVSGMDFLGGGVGMKWE